MPIIRLQLIGGFFYPTDAISRQTLEKDFRLDRIPERRLSALSSKMVWEYHYALAITDYEPSASDSYSPPRGQKIGGDPRAVQNPCERCRLNGLCGDECGRKLFPLHKRVSR